ncbi:tetratricopeptide repeat protein [Flammeovirgaceae bacterium SG7u.111]|nr:tetratricopeptide repeat protein [Flammeovirgaceae bacterium SG7u.132]WPO36908.1 tetratricopeptide repeat protein [Flammeovirgaceae bacterium SG7u.111]
MKNIKVLVLFMISLVLLLAPEAELLAQKKKKKKGEYKAEQEALEEGIAKVMDERNLAHAEYLFFEGMKYYVLEDYKKALSVFEESDQLNPDSPATKYKMSQLLNKLGRYDESLALAQKAVELGNDNEFYYKQLAELYKQKKEYAKVVETYKAMMGHVEGKEEYLFDLAQAYLFLSEYDKAIEAYDKIEELYGMNDAVVRQKQRIYLNTQKLGKALEEGEKLIKAFPGNSRYVLSQAEILVSVQKGEEAQQLVEQFLETYPNEPAAELFLAKIYLLKGQSEKAYELAEVAFANPDLLFSDKIDVLVGELKSVYDGKPNAQGLKLAKIASETHPESGQANSIYADFLIGSGDKQAGRDYYLKALTINADNFKVWQQVLNIDWEMQQFDSLEKHADTALEYFPNQVGLYLYKGTAAYVNKNYEEAMDVLESGLMLAIDPRQKNQFNSQLGDVYNSLEEYDRSDDAYEAVLKEDPNNVYVLNNYAYFLSLRKEKMDKAKSMGEKLVQLEPNNPTYLDTFGWVLYVMEEYGEAQKYLKKAVENSPDNGTIIEHYADALYRTGDKDNALKYWKQALEVGGSESEELLKQKIANKSL